MICFELAYDNVISDVMKGGAQVLVVQTNNATYGGTGQPEQQFAITRMRAIETGRTVLIASTSGISGVIRPDGTVEHKSAQFVPDVYVATVPVRDTHTLASTTRRLAAVDPDRPRAARHRAGAGRPASAAYERRPADAAGRHAQPREGSGLSQGPLRVRRSHSFRTLVF